MKQLKGAGGGTCSRKRSVGAKRPFVALAAVKPRVMCGANMWLASKREPSPPALMNMSCTQPEI